MATEFQINWDNFGTNWINGFQESYSRGEFLDITLAAEGQTIQAHRLVLAACSPFFRKLLLEIPTNQQNPIIYLKDVKMSILQDILYYIYFGKINVKEECLVEFVATAESLDIKGISVEIENIGNDMQEEHLNEQEDNNENVVKTPERTISVTEPKDFGDFELNSNVTEPNTTPTSHKIQIARKRFVGCLPKLKLDGDNVAKKKKLVEVPNGIPIPYKNIAKPNEAIQNNFNIIDQEDKLVLKKQIGYNESLKNLHEPAQFEVTNRGTHKLIHNGFFYFKVNKSKTNQTNWICSNNNIKDIKCHARAITRNENGVEYIIEITKSHNNECKSRKELNNNNM
ncbi:hypothetical protein PVAND_002779 [Polypedilum vanderplanki]|uniref:BTB domain-containing protein n=1 Tax=Polypedilum vanderplanki TaxID=319348 RepID=A0A9J6BS17_POLVA|nr:hypothetical protein PVAND_002779 [Polypedilum vanderplanki]